jgi:acyl CoA:acetate/3-ketoacid CoA transferase beta subunit
MTRQPRRRCRTNSQSCCQTRDFADGVTLDEVKSKTEAEFRVALKNT